MIALGFPVLPVGQMSIGYDLPIVLGPFECILNLKFQVEILAS